MRTPKVGDQYTANHDFETHAEAKFEKGDIIEIVSIIDNRIELQKPGTVGIKGRCGFTMLEHHMTLIESNPEHDYEDKIIPIEPGIKSIEVTVMRGGKPYNFILTIPDETE